ncbi:MAG: hypothetical protein IJ811_05320 [Clostridia bacterium]|nr:hypothetical protein [Clostridia bacterium]
MIMFLYDNKIAQFEQNKEYNSILTYLVTKYEQAPSSILINTIIGYSWYLLISHEFYNESWYNWIDYEEKWIKYMNIGKVCFAEDASVNFIIGYTLSISWEYIANQSDFSEKDGLTYIKKSVDMASDCTIKQLTMFFLNRSLNYSRKTKCLPKEIVHELFPHASLIDNYFKEIIYYND